MSRGFIKKVLLFAAAVGVVALVAGCSNLEPGVVARLYDNQTISEDQMKTRANGIAIKGSASKGVDVSTVDPSEYYPDAVRELVLERIMDHEAEGKGVVVTDADAQAAFDLILSQDFMGNKELMLKSLSAPEEDIKLQLKSQKIVQQMQQEVTTNIDVTEEDIRASYDKYVAAYGSPEWRKLGVIVVADEAQARNVKKIFDSGGQDFTKLVLTYTIDEVTRKKGGSVSLNKTREDVLPPEVKAVAFKTMVGLVTDPIKTDKGYYVIWVQDVEPDKDTPYELVKPKFEGIATEEKMKQTWQDFLDQAEADAHVEYRKDVRPPKD